VDLSATKAQAKAQRPTPHTGVKHVQRALNLKTGPELRVDGVFGATTRAAYLRFELQTNPKSDGGVSEHSLKRLGAARFRVAR
jgi:peptidoglycan hydrolase-like protein with peptidoglycan-binding domain